MSMYMWERYIEYESEFRFMYNTSIRTITTPPSWPEVIRISIIIAPKVSFLVSLIGGTSLRAWGTTLLRLVV